MLTSQRSFSNFNSSKISRRDLVTRGSSLEEMIMLSSKCSRIRRMRRMKKTVKRTRR
jgi:hypothetical protein